MIFENEEVLMNKVNNLIATRIKVSLAMALLTVVVGCWWGFEDEHYGGRGYDGYSTVPYYDNYFYGGAYERGHEAHEYSHRGRESRSSAHAEVRQSAPSVPHSSGGGSTGRRR
jgi:hypothetical protein